jgi:predicted kinase
VIDRAQRRLVLVSGAPGSGKTTLAGPLAAELGFTLLAKDRIKETLGDWLGPSPASPSNPPSAAAEPVDPGWSRRLGAASMELLWALAADAPAVVLEANFWPGDPRQRDRVSALAATPVEVFCECPAEVCLQRYAERARVRHAVHVDDSQLGRLPALVARSGSPLGLGPVLTADTTAPVDIPALARAVRGWLP